MIRIIVVATFGAKGAPSRARPPRHMAAPQTIPRATRLVDPACIMRCDSQLPPITTKKPAMNGSAVSLPASDCSKPSPFTRYGVNQDSTSARPKYAPKYEHQDAKFVG